MAPAQRRVVPNVMPDDMPADTPNGRPNVSALRRTEAHNDLANAQRQVQPPAYMPIPIDPSNVKSTQCVCRV